MPRASLGAPRSRLPPRPRSPSPSSCGSLSSASTPPPPVPLPPDPPERARGKRRRGSDPPPHTPPTPFSPSLLSALASLPQGEAGVSASPLSPSLLSLASPLLSSLSSPSYGPPLSSLPPHPHLVTPLPGAALLVPFARTLTHLVLKPSPSQALPLARRYKSSLDNVSYASAELSQRGGVRALVLDSSRRPNSALVRRAELSREGVDRAILLYYKLEVDPDCAVLPRAPVRRPAPRVLPPPPPPEPPRSQLEVTHEELRLELKRASASTSYGFCINTATTQTSYCPVLAVRAGSIASRAGLRAGDLITEVGGGAYQSGPQLGRIMEDSIRIKLTVIRDGVR
ncbi:hypothetical protein TeGR_g6205, partial [Tetraparma gracilis]